MLKVLIVAPYASVRAGLQVLLAQSGQVEVVGEASGSEDLKHLIGDSRHDSLLLDYSSMDGPAVIALAAQAEIPLVVLGDDRDGYRSLAAVAQGGWGYLLKDAEGDEITGALLAAASGVAALDRSLVTTLPDSAKRADLGAEAASGTESLTARELDVLQLMASGLPNKTIASRLGISQHTVKFHVAAILSKLGASSRTEAVTLGARRGLVAL